MQLGSSLVPEKEGFLEEMQMSYNEGLMGVHEAKAKKTPRAEA